MNANVLELTVSQRVATDDNTSKSIPIKITVNWDHIRTLAPRVEGGTIITFADKSALVCAESRFAIWEQLKSGNARPHATTNDMKKSITKKAAVKPVKKKKARQKKVKK
jgi:hypothetical protein